MVEIARTLGAGGCIERNFAEFTSSWEARMRTSAKVAMSGWGSWIFFGLISNVVAPTPDEFFGDPEGSVAGLQFFGALSNISLVVGVVSTAVFAFRAIMDKSVSRHEYHGPVDQSRITASGHAAVATGGSRIDQRGMFVDRSVTIQNT